MGGLFFAQFERPLHPGDVVVPLGTSTTLEQARRHVDRVKVKPGFADEPTRFSIEHWAFDVVQWTRGFVMSATTHGPDLPQWAKRQQPIAGESGRAYARRLCDARYGLATYHRGPTSEYAQLKKRVSSRRSPTVEQNEMPHSPRVAGRRIPRDVWTLSHEHERSDAQQHFSDHVKFLGFFSSRDKARSAKATLASKPGFRETANGFSIERCALDVPQWQDGFTIYAYGEDDGARGIVPAWFMGPTAE